MRLHTPLLALAAATLAGCYVPSAPDEVLHGVVTATNYRQVANFPANFAAYTNVLLSPTVAVVDDTNGGPVTITPTVNDGVVAGIRKNLEARGYTVSTDAAAAGAGALKVGAYALFSSVNLYYSDYWCSWYYYYYCTPTVSYAGSYNYGTLVVEAGDELQNPGDLPPTPGVASKLAWTSASYGVMAGGNAITANSPGYAKVLGSIDQAFAQSPYFTK
jgi:hypothetical protein